MHRGGVKPGRAATPPEGDDEGDDADQDRHRPDVEKADPGLQRLDVLAQGVLHVAQLAAQLEHLAAEVLDRLLLLGGQQHAALGFLLLKFGDLGLGRLDVLQQRYDKQDITAMQVDLSDDISEPARLAHIIMGGSQSIFSHYEMYPDYLAKMNAAYGEERTREILSYNKHNTLIYPSCTVRDGIQSIRVVKPVSVNETVIESWTFRLKGAPQDMLDRTLRYSRLINSPASVVGPDDMNCYDRIQEAAEAGAIEWIDLHRHLGREEQQGKRTTAIGTSDLALRNQYVAWLEYMTDGEGEAHAD